MRIFSGHNIVPQRIKLFKIKQIREKSPTNHFASFQAVIDMVFSSSKHQRKEKKGCIWLWVALTKNSRVCHGE